MSPLTLQQQRAVETIDSDVLVSAGAGSGKTHVLVERFIEILRKHGDASVSDVVAVTFTKKAAMEMRTRLKSRLKELMDASISDEDRSRWRQCLGEVDGARIGTIHSLCQTILKSFPVEAGVDPQIEVLDDLERAELVQESIEQSFREVISEKAPSHAVLLDFKLQDVKDWIGRALLSTTQFQEAISRLNLEDEKVWTQFARSFISGVQDDAVNEVLSNRNFRDAIEYLMLNPWRDPENKLGITQAHVLRTAFELEKSRYQLPPHTAPNPESAESIGEQLEVTLPNQRFSALMTFAAIALNTSGGNSEEAKELRAHINQIRDLAKNYKARIPEDLVEADLIAYRAMQGLCDLVQRATRIFSQLKEESLKLDFNDLIELAVKALSGKESQAREFYNSTIKAILVDEFQDTNRMQSRFIRLLAGEETKLFLIGDDKQSIYSFQGADVATFNEWKDQLSSRENAELLTLNKSFRSHPSVVAFVNAVFASLMAPESATKDYMARFEELSAARDEESDFPRTEVVLFSTLDPDEREDALALKQGEGHAVARWVHDLISRGCTVSDKRGGARPMAYGDFAVLVRRNKDAGHIEEALAAHGIPYVTLGGKGFLDRQEIHDFVNLLSFLASPRDDHSLLGVLRSPIFAITDDVIHVVCAPEKRAGKSIWKTISNEVKTQGPSSDLLRRPVALLKHWLADAEKLTVTQLLRKIILQTHYDLVMMAMPNGHQRSRNIWKLVWMASDSEDLSCGEFAERIRLMREYKVTTSDAPLDAGNAVKIMTLHASKGLEFPAVAMPVLSQKQFPKTDKMIFHNQFGLAFNATRFKEEEKPSWYQVASKVSSDMEEAENRRLLYVGTTRARDYLGLFVQHSKNGTDNSFRSWLDNLLGFNAEDSPRWEKTFKGGKHTAQFTGMQAERCFDSCGTEPGAITHIPVSEAAVQKLDLLDVVSSDLLPMASETRRPPRITPALPPQGLIPGLSAFVGNKPKQSHLKLDATLVGTFFHALVEHLAVDSAVLSKEVIESIAIAQGDAVSHPSVLQQLLIEGERLLDIFYRSELREALCSSKRSFPELPYFVFDESGLETKRPDLLFEDINGEWQLIDFKTDHFELTQLQKQTRSHEKQLKEYVGDLKTIVGISAKPWIYFAQFGLMHPV